MSSLVSQALSIHSLHCSIATWCCRTLCNCILLSSTDAKERVMCQDKLADLRVPQLLMDGFTARMQSMSMSMSMDVLSVQWLLKAVGSIARYHPSNCQLFMSLHIADLVKKIQDQFLGSNKSNNNNYQGNDYQDNNNYNNNNYNNNDQGSNTVCEEDEQTPVLIENLCWVVGNLSYPSEEFQSMWADSGACQLILDALIQHTSNEEVVQEALRALRNVCYEHDANLDLLFQLGVVKALMGVINHHRDHHDGWQVKKEEEEHHDTSADVLQWVWYAVAALSAHEPILFLLGSEGICDHVASSLLRFNNRPDLVQWVALAVSKVMVTCWWW